MKKVYQKVINKGHGDCMRAVVASILDLESEEVPNFIEMGDKWIEPFIDFFAKYGFEIEGCLYSKDKSINRLYDFSGINGLFVASVYSPKYYNPNDAFPITHAVVIDKNYNIIHDPNPEYKNLKSYPLADKIGYNGIKTVYLLIKHITKRIEGEI